MTFQKSSSVGLSIYIIFGLFSVFNAYSILPRLPRSPVRRLFSPDMGVVGVGDGEDDVQPASQKGTWPTQHIGQSTKEIDNPVSTSRRLVVSLAPAIIMAATLAVVDAPQASALDIDSFIQNELKSDACDDKTSKKCKPKLSEDEAMCRFGQPSPKTGEACLRAGLPTKRPSGVDAFGKVDRGDFVRCKANYVEDPKNPGFLVNVWKCD